jgi:flavin-dependent dehydrogenase
MSSRVVITGIGAITAIGNGKDGLWRGIQRGESGVPPEPLEPLQSAHPLQVPANRPAGSGVFLAGDALRVLEPFTGQGIFFAVLTGEMAAEAIGCPSRSEERYAAAGATLYLRRARTNESLRHAMYRERAARVVIPLVRHAPRLARWLADNVLGGER